MDDDSDSPFGYTEPTPSSSFDEHNYNDDNNGNGREEVVIVMGADDDDDDNDNANDEERNEDENEKERSEDFTSTSNSNEGEGIIYRNNDDDSDDELPMDYNFELKILEDYSSNHRTTHPNANAQSRSNNNNKPHKQTTTQTIVKPSHDLLCNLLSGALMAPFSDNEDESKPTPKQTFITLLSTAHVQLNNAQTASSLSSYNNALQLFKQCVKVGTYANIDETLVKSIQVIVELCESSIHSLKTVVVSNPMVNLPATTNTSTNLNLNSNTNNSNKQSKNHVQPNNNHQRDAINRIRQAGFNKVHVTGEGSMSASAFMDMNVDVGLGKSAVKQNVREEAPVSKGNNEVEMMLKLQNELIHLSMNLSSNNNNKQRTSPSASDANELSKSALNLASSISKNTHMHGRSGRSESVMEGSFCVVPASFSDKTNRNGGMKGSVSVSVSGGSVLLTGESWSGGKNSNNEINTKQVLKLLQTLATLSTENASLVKNISALNGVKEDAVISRKERAEFVKLYSERFNVMKVRLEKYRCEYPGVDNPANVIIANTTTPGKEKEKKHLQRIRQLEAEVRALREDGEKKDRDLGTLKLFYKDVKARSRLKKDTSNQQQQEEEQEQQQR